MEKSYCSECEFHISTRFIRSKCLSNMRDSPIRKNNIADDCYTKNKNNDCQEFKPKIPFMTKLKKFLGVKDVE